MIKKPTFSHNLTTEFKRIAAGVEINFELWGITLKVDFFFFTYEVHCDWNE